MDFNEPNQKEKPTQSLFQHLPNDDKSLGTFGDIRDGGSIDSKENTIESSTSQKSGQKRSTFTITPDKLKTQYAKRSKNTVDIPDNESLTDNDAETIETLTSKMDFLESGQKIMEGKFDMLVGLLSKGDGSGNSQVQLQGQLNPDPKGDRSRL